MEWRPATRRCGLELKARLNLVLAEPDSSKADRYDEARRATRLDEAIIQDRLAFLRDVALRNPSAARLWWLHRNLEGSEPETSWEVFDQIVRPLITNADPLDDQATRFAKTVLKLVDRVHGKPDRLRTLIQVATVLLSEMGWPDLADEFATMSPLQSSDDGKDGT